MMQTQWVIVDLVKIISVAEVLDMNQKSHKEKYMNYFNYPLGHNIFSQHLWPSQWVLYRILHVQILENRYRQLGVYGYQEKHRVWNYEDSSNLEIRNLKRMKTKVLAKWWIFQNQVVFQKWFDVKITEVLSGKKIHICSGRYAQTYKSNKSIWINPSFNFICKYKNCCYERYWNCCPLNECVEFLRCLSSTSPIAILTYQHFKVW